MVDDYEIYEEQCKKIREENDRLPVPNITIRKKKIRFSCGKRALM